MIKTAAGIKIIKARGHLWFFFALIAVIFGSPMAPLASAGSPPDIIILNSQGSSRSKADMPPARFSHSVHKKNKVGCKECHPSPFKAKKGANKITMKENINGDFCGKCHMGGGKYLLSNWNMSDCQRCHK